MTSWNTIKNELQELNSNLPLTRVAEPYQVPQGYFESFAASVLQRIKSENLSAEDELKILSPVLAGLSKKMPFSMPDGYFNDVTQSISSISADESLPDVLLKAGKKMPYVVPAGYFENLSGELLKKLEPARPAAKVISIGAAKWMRYAAAAVVAGIIVLSSLVYFNGNKTADSSSSSEDWIAKQLKNVSDKELDAFIITTDADATTLANNHTGSKTEIRKLLKDVPEGELEKFLDEVPFDSEDALSGYN